MRGSTRGEGEGGREAQEGGTEGRQGHHKTYSLVAVNDWGLAGLRGGALEDVLGHQSPQLVHVHGGAVVPVVQLVPVTHANLAKVARVAGKGREGSSNAQDVRQCHMQGVGGGRRNGSCPCAGNYNWKCE